MPDAHDQWIVLNGMGGYVCGECGMPVESEPCPEHQPEAYGRIEPIAESGGSR